MGLRRQTYYVPEIVNCFSSKAGDILFRLADDMMPLEPDTGCPNCALQRFERFIPLVSSARAAAGRRGRNEAGYDDRSIGALNDLGTARGRKRDLRAQWIY